MSEKNHVEESSSPTSTKDKFLGYGCLAWVLIGLFGLTCIGLLISQLLLAVSAPREAARRIQCRSNLKQIGLALHNYHQAYGSYPPAYTVDEQGKPMHSWRVLLLPFTEYAQDEVQYDFSQPWNSPANLAFAKESQIHNMYFCPSESDWDRNDTSYVMLVGPNAFSDGPTARKKEDITDKPGETIIVGEMSRSGIFWTEPRDLSVSEMSFKINDPNQIGLRSDHYGGLHVLFADGSVCFLSASMDMKVYEAMTTINGGEDISEFY